MDTDGDAQFDVNEFTGAIIKVFHANAVTEDGSPAAGEEKADVTGAVAGDQVRANRVQSTSSRSATGGSGRGTVEGGLDNAPLAAPDLTTAVAADSLSTLKARIATLSTLSEEQRLRLLKTESQGATDLEVINALRVELDQARSDILVSRENVAAADKGAPPMPFPGGDEHKFGAGDGDQDRVLGDETRVRYLYMFAYTKLLVLRLLRGIYALH